MNSRSLIFVLRLVEYESARPADVVVALLVDNPSSILVHQDHAVTWRDFQRHRYAGLIEVPVRGLPATATHSPYCPTSRPSLYRLHEVPLGCRYRASAVNGAWLETAQQLLILTVATGTKHDRLVGPQKDRVALGSLAATRSPHLFALRSIPVTRCFSRNFTGLSLTISFN